MSRTRSQTRNARPARWSPLLLTEPGEPLPGPLTPIGYIERAVCERYQIRTALVSDPRRRCRPEVDARHITWYLCCREGWSLTTIGRYYRRHHATILHGRDRVEALLEQDPERRERVLGILDDARRLVP